MSSQWSTPRRYQLTIDLRWNADHPERPSCPSRWFFMLLGSHLVFWEVQTTFPRDVFSLEILLA
jgi:hypothetical protein